MALDWTSADAGVDEAGRGPLAGPVFAAAVILAVDTVIVGLTDSKRLSASQRARLEIEIKARSAAWAIGRAEVDEIDRLNILRASLLAMQRAVLALPNPPSQVWIDGNQAPDLPYTMHTVIHGDSLVAPISAASILAKEARDRVMLDLDAEYPCYGFRIHKGYPTQAHLQALRDHGVSPVHRRSFRPVRLCLAETVIASECKS
jgi:ribonuclease HII